MTFVLYMKRILITRPRTQADNVAEKLRLAGFEPVFFPVIEIQPIENNDALEQALSKLNCYEWVIFTSANAVDIVFDRYSSLLLGDKLGVKFAAILDQRLLMFCEHAGYLSGLCPRGIRL